jgi:DNA-binding response OmpR family regulator/two-component sensor histidine kinase
MKDRLQMNAVYTNITHELLTPLTVISASVDRLRDKEPNYELDYNLMQQNIDRMVRLLQQILETSKSLSGELKLLVAQGDIMQYIRQTAYCIEPLMAKKGIDFTVTCVPESMMGWIDTDKLDKIIYNLLSNAAKYSISENGKVALQVRTNKKFDHVIITVSDNGIGIPHDKMKKLFQRYFDGAYRRQKTTGTGLGLALTRELVFLHGGNIDCESEEGKGTTFTVTLPIKKEAFNSSQIDDSHKIDINLERTPILDIDTRIKKQEPEKEQPVLSEDAYRLLIVEDNIELLMLMNQLLNNKYYVKTATNGKEALDIIQKEELDIIISDVMMPVMNGLELTRKVKSDPNFQHLPIILLTAKTQENDREEALQIGADSYVTKPFKLKDLELRINNIIENRKRIQEEFISQLSNTSVQPQNEINPTPDELFLKRAMECVHQHLDDSEYDRDRFASDMGASASTLYNKLRALTGLNVSNFIRDIRMKEAMRMAQHNPQIRISDLAYKVGFKDPKYFSTCFKKEFGLQPTEYLESLYKAQET